LQWYVALKGGGLEYKGLCMLLSLRLYWGKYKDINIYAYSPRKDNIISGWLQEIYKDNNITLVDDPINRDYVDYPLANKPLSMAHAEKNLSEEYLVFLDSDILCWNEPELFFLPETKDLGMVVDFTKTMASYGPSDEECEPMWRSLYDIADVRFEPYVKTLLSDEIVRGWWCSGVIACRRSAGLMNRWMELFNESMRKVPFIPKSYYLKEQMTLCALAASVYERFCELPVSYNYPVQNFKHYTCRGYRPEDAILWHYQPYMNKSFKDFQQKMDRVDGKSEKLRIAERFIQKAKTDYPKMIGLDESIFSRYRRQLKIGPRFRKLIGKTKETDPLV
jgi:hypothetical protein